MFAFISGFYLIARPAFERAADQRLVREGTVHLRGVPEVDAELERAVQHAHRLRVVRGAVGERHPHAAQAERRHLDVTDFVPASASKLRALIGDGSARLRLAEAELRLLAPPDDWFVLHLCGRQVLRRKQIRHPFA